MLEVLDIGNNKLTDTFPYWLGTLPKLQVLVLRSNKFFGFLRIIDLSNNNFNGVLPTRYFASLKAMMNVDVAKSKLEYMRNYNYYYSYYDSIFMIIKRNAIEMVKILNIFTIIDFSHNSFSEEIPEEIGKLQSLHLLNLSQNLLIGHISLSLGNLTAIELLDLSSNRLVGEIPRQLASLNCLGVLNLSRNQLSGPIPRGSQLDTFENDSYSDNLGLCGFPLSNDCHRDETSQPSRIAEDDTKSEFAFGWKVVLIGYGFGTVLGMTMGYLVFSTGKPWWLVRIVEKENSRIARRLNNRCRVRRN
ncbi:hypothetical protein ACOSQ2_017465 [Xanthoceras sorbifolium]